MAEPMYDMYGIYVLTQTLQENQLNHFINREKNGFTKSECSGYLTRSVANSKLEIGQSSHYKNNSLARIPFDNFHYHFQYDS